MDRRLTPESLRHIAGRCTSELHVQALTAEIRACWADLVAARNERDSALETVLEWVQGLRESADSLDHDSDIRSLATWLEMLLDHDLDEDFPGEPKRRLAVVPKTGPGGASLTGPLSGAEVHRGR